MNGETQIIVATSAFGMGVDKQDVGLVVHYDISDSLENYVQEAGRAGRNENINADCYVLFNNNDLDKHFVLLNQAKLVGDNKGFSLYDLAELRHFMKLIDTKSKSPTVSDEIWDEAKQRLQSHYKNSVNLELCLNLLGDFERSNVKKYKNSLEIFIKESRLEDFFKDD